jgi:hypothetical protein
MFLGFNGAGLLPIDFFTSTALMGGHWYVKFFKSGGYSP